MSSPHPFPLLALPRAVAALGRLQKEIWGEETPLALEATASRPDYVTWEEATQLPRETVIPPQPWGQLFDQRWFRIDLPADRDAAALLRWKDEGEATLYVDGMPYYGFDNAHHAVRIPAGVREVWIEAICARAGIWFGQPGLSAEGSHLRGATLARRDDAAFEAHVILEFLLGIAREENRAADPLRPDNGFRAMAHTRPLDDASPFYRRLLRALDEAVDAFDRDGVPALRSKLEEIIARFPAPPSRLRAVLTGHAHIDLVWLWPEKVGERKAVHTFSSMLRLLESDPEFRFGYTQPASYRAVERIAPWLMEQVRARIGEGRWEATGATWVESDTLIACGEALLRSFRLGQKAFAELSGAPARVLWLPDVFGYAACLPQLMRMHGVEFFYTTKLTWSVLNRFPHSSFRWIGNDGSEVVAHVSQENGYNELLDPARLRLAERAYRQADVHDEFLIPTGVGDGGGGTSEEMLIRARVAARMEGVPETRWGRIDAFFDRLAEAKERLPAWQGELYLEYHRGTYTTHGEVKAAFRAAERALQALEAVHAATGRGPIEERRWERVVFGQFHDYIPGSSIEEVYREAVPELTGITAASLEDSTRALGEAGGEALFNPLPLARTVLANGEAVELSPLAGGPVAGLKRVGDAVTGDERRLENGRVSAAFDEAGRIGSLRIDGRDIALAAPAGELELFVDRPAMFDAWDVDRQALDLGCPVDAPAAARFTQSNPAEASVEFHRSFGAKSTVTTRYRLLAGEAVLRVEYEVDFQEPQAWLKVHFPTRYAGRTARFGGPFGSVSRGQQAGDPRDEAQWEAPASRWAVVADESGLEGLALVTEAKYGFSAREGRMSLSLVRSPVPSGGENDPGPGLYPAKIRREVSPFFTDLGPQVIRIALGAFATSLPTEQHPAALADTLFTPPVSYRGSAVSAGLATVENAGSLIPAWAEPLGDGRWALRLHETLGARGVATVRAQEGWIASFGGASGGEIAVAFTPYAILTVGFARSA